MSSSRSARCQYETAIATAIQHEACRDLAEADVDADGHARTSAASPCSTALLGVHADDPVGEPARLGRVVGDGDRRKVEALAQVGERRLHGVARVLVERGGRLVEQ